jgi:hypothetical protein
MVNNNADIKYKTEVITRAAASGGEIANHKSKITRVALSTNRR